MAPKQSQQLALPEDPRRKVLAHYFNLQTSIQLLTNQVAHTGSRANVQTYNAAAVNADINGIGEYLSSQLEPIYYNERRQPDSAKATKVFNIPELLEMILESTEFIDILHTSETCRSIRDIIYASTKLQVRLYLRPMELPEDAEMEFESPLVNKYEARHFLFKGYSVTTKTNLTSPEELNYLAQFFDDRSYNTAEETKLYITFEEISWSRLQRRIGKSWKDTIICQPPIKHMFVIPECGCFATRNDRNKSKSISSESGFTLDELLALAKKLFKRGCIICYLTKEADKRYEKGWDETSVSEDSDEIEAPLRNVTFEAVINLPEESTGSSSSSSSSSSQG
jgi:hypothetical protein